MPFWAIMHGDFLRFLDHIMETLRSFIALELPPETKVSLSRIVQGLKNECGPVRWVDPKSIHITLKFLGNIEANTIDLLEEGISQASAGIPPFYLRLGKLGAFPGLRMPKVVWVGLEGEIAALHALQEKIERVLIPLGFPGENRKFAPHLTLGRIRDSATPPERRLIGDVIGRAEQTAGTPFEVNSVSLMRSKLTPGGALYTRMASVDLRNT